MLSLSSELQVERPDPLAAVKARFAKDSAMISTLIEEKHALRIELAAVKAELRGHLGAPAGQ